jgi:hypothetical protein
MRGRVTRLVGLLLSALVVGCATSPKPVPAPAGSSPPKADLERGTPAKPKSKAAKPASRPRRRSVADVMATLGIGAERRLRGKFASRGLAYPPSSVALLAFKQERRIELWASHGAAPAYVASYPLTDTSGTLGPKLREGDYQIPEGIYRVTWLHPNSQYHLSLKLDYPNRFDLARAAEDGRKRLGGDIFVHGDEHSIGCLAVGDPAIEELFALAARVGREQVTVLIAPWDFRRRPPPASAANPPWLPTLYAQLAAQLGRFRGSP